MSETAAASVATRQPLQLEDLFALTTIADARLSPDGRTVACTLQRSDLDHNRNLAAIWLVPADAAGGAAAPRRLTDDDSTASAPRWSPDGASLAFLSDRSGTRQLYLLERSADGFAGPPRQLTRLSRAVSTPVWSPDGTRLAFTTSEGHGLDDADRNRPGGVIRHITRRRYRFDGAGYMDDRFEHIWVVDVASGAARPLTWGEHDNSLPAWSPDGAAIACLSTREDERRTYARTRLYHLDVPADLTAMPDRHGPDSARRLSPDDLVVSAATWSPDGSQLAIIGMPQHRQGGETDLLYLLPAAGGLPRALTETLDRSPGGGNFGDTWSSSGGEPVLFWTPAGDAVSFTAGDRGRVHLFSAGLDGSIRTLIGGDRTVGFVTASADGSRLAFAAGDFVNPCDLYACQGDGTGERRLTSLNRALLDTRAVQTPEPLPFANDAGVPIDAWLIPPVGPVPAGGAPLVQIIHGGPHGVFGHIFFFDMQLWASLGYHVLFVNPTGSASYGAAFGRGNNGNWGEGDGREQLLALDAALARGGIDPSRLAVTGLSYGGYMTNWLIGHTDRYVCAVSENSIANLISNSLVSDLQLLHPELDLQGDLWGKLEYYLRLSPITYAPRVKTPTLFLQSEDDYRCPIEEGEQMYTALQIHGVETEMVRFPGESHGVLRNGKPQSRLVRRQHSLRWFARYLNR